MNTQIKPSRYIFCGLSLGSRGQRFRRARAALVVLAAGMSLSGSGHAVQIVWTNTSGGAWSVPANWSPNQAPGSADDACITNDGTYTVTLDASAAVASLTIGGASGTQSFAANANSLTLNGASTVGTNGSFNLGGGTLSGAGSLAVNGPFTWSSGTINNTGGVTLNGASSLDGAGNGTMFLYGLLINGGTLTWGGSGNNLYLGGGTLTNLASGTITISADVSSANVGTIGNAGLLRKIGGTGTTTFNANFVNSGDVQVQSGTLDLNGGGSASGTFEVSANAWLVPNNYTLSSPAGITGAGTVSVLSGTLNLNGANTIGVSTTFSLGGGTLNGAGSLAVNGPFTWSSGTIQNTGGVTLNGASSLDGAGSGAMFLYGLLINGGTLTWGGSGNNLYLGSGTLTNLASGTITISADVSSAGGGTIGNAGVLRKTGTTGTTTLNAIFVNSGDVQAQGGTLDLNGGGSASGTFEVSANAALQFGNSYALGSASSVTGAGSVTFSAGTVNLSGTLSLSGTNTISGGTLAVNSPGSMAVTNLIILGGGSLNGNVPVAVNGPFTWSSGTINNTGGVTLNGASSLDGAGNGTMFLYGLLINGGTLTWGGSGNNLYLGGGTLTNLASGTITISADVSSANVGTIGNAGLLRKIGGTGTTTFNANFVNSGDVQVQSGTLDLNGGGSASGTFEVSANAWLVPNNYTLSSPAGITGAGTVSVLSGTLNLNGANTIGVSTTFSLGGGTLNGAGSLAVNGPFTWSSGTIQNTGGVTLNGASSLDGAGSGAMFLYGLLINGGTLTWGGSGNNLYLGGGTLTNLASGTITISADVSSAGGGTIGNAGVLRKTGTTGTTTLNAIFVNGGDVQAQGGTLDLNGGGSASGTFEVSANATLQFGNSYALGSASSVTGAGSVTFSAGTVNLSGTLSMSGTNTISGGTLALNSPGSMAVTNLIILGGGSLNGNAPVAVNGPFTWSNGTINNTGGVTLNGASSLDGAGNNTMFLDGLLINGGTLTWGGNGNNLYLGGGTLTNLASGTITISADVSSANAGTIGNAGLLRKTGTTGTTTLNAIFVNSGDVQAQSGTLDLNGGGSASGTFEVSANAALQFGNSYALGSASSVTGAGSVTFNAGTVNLSGTLSMSGTVFISGGTLAVNSPGSMAVTNLIILGGGSLNGNAPVAVNGPFTWSNGTINNTGGVTLNGASSLDGAGNNTMFLYGLLINGGTLTWGGNGNNLYLGSGTLTNLASGTITISADISSANVGTIGNAGVLRKTGTTGTTTLNAIFVNSGEVQVQSGTLDLDGGGSASGTLEVSANAALQFGNSYALGSASSVTGAGSLTFSAGTVNLSGTLSLSGTNTISGGTLAVNSPGTMAVTNLIILGGGSLNGDAPVAVNGPFTWSSGTINNTGGVTLNGASSLDGAGNNTMFLDGLLINGGTLTWGGSGNNLYLGGGTLTNLASGTITISADVSSANVGTIGNAGLLRKTGGTGTTTLYAAFVNSGTVQANSGMLSFASTFFQTAGQMALNGGNFAFSQVAQLLGGTITGAGAITGSISNNAAIGTGASPGLLSISGNYTEGPNAQLAIKLGGTSAGASYDQLSVGGTVALAGTLNISYWNGFTSSVADVFTVLTCGTRTGAFSAVASPGTNLDAVYTATNVLVLPHDAVPTVQLNVPAQVLAGHTFVVAGSGSYLEGTVTNFTLLQGTNVLLSVPAGSGQVNYSSDFPGNLTFTAQATGNNGVQAQSNATVTITTLPLLTLDAIGFQTNLGFKLLMLGGAGTNYQVLVSTNLAVKNWTTLGTMQSTNGIWRYFDATATNLGQHFYRAKQLP